MNTHQKYQTIGHCHFDFTYRKNDSWEYPESGLLLIECGDGRWFIEQDFGDEYDRFAGVVKSSDDVLTEPTFYANVEDVARAAFALIKQVYPTTPDVRLTDFLTS